MSLTEEQHRLLYRIAQAYYADELTQREIAERFGLSRPKVSRLLQKGREQGIINITLVPPHGGLTDLERELEQEFCLEEVVVASATNPQSLTAVTRELGPPGANCLVRSLHGDEIVGLSWGTTLLAVVDALPTQSWPEMKVVQMLGGLGSPEAETHGADLTYRMAEAFGARPRLLPSPGIVPGKEVRDALLADSQVADTLDLAARADIAVVGIGAPIPGSVVARTGAITPQVLDQLKARGAVGDIALHFIDADGQPVDHEINDRVVALDLERIRQIPRVIGVAGGPEKFHVIRAALRGKLVDVLVTDAGTARALLAEALVKRGD